MKIILLTTLLLTGCGGYNVQNSGLIGAPIETALYWAFGGTYEQTRYVHVPPAQTINVIDWTVR